MLHLSWGTPPSLHFTSVYLSENDTYCLLRSNSLCCARLKEGRVPGGTGDERTPWPWLLPNESEGNQGNQRSSFRCPSTWGGHHSHQPRGDGANSEAAAALSPSRRATDNSDDGDDDWRCTDDHLEPQQQGSRWRHDNSSIASRQSVGEDARNNSRLQSVRVVSAGQKRSWRWPHAPRWGAWSQGQLLQRPHHDGEAAARAGEKRKRGRPIATGAAACGGHASGAGSLSWAWVLTASRFGSTRKAKARQKEEKRYIIYDTHCPPFHRAQT